LNVIFQLDSKPLMSGHLFILTLLFVLKRRISFSNLSKYFRDTLCL